MTHDALVATQWLMSAISVTCNWLIGRKRSIGWFLSAVGLVVGIGYNVFTSQYGFVAAQVPMLVISVQNFVKWRRNDVRYLFTTDAGTGRLVPADRNRNRKRETDDERHVPEHEDDRG